MKYLISLEEAAITAVSIYFLSHHNLGLSIWIWIPLFLSPDISMLGYLMGTWVGAVIYNLFHHRGVALAVAGTGYYLHNELFVAIGILLFAYSSFDRMMGYGLKFSDSFKHTHLGWLPEKNKL